MRAYLLTTLCPALVLLAAACGPTDTADTSAAAPSAAPETAAAPPASEPAAAPAETAAATPPPAQPAAASDEPDPVLAAIALRQSPMKLLSFNFGPMRGMMQPTGTYDGAIVERNATRIVTLASMIPAVFETDTSASTLETQALPSIWTNKADFDAKAQALQDAASAVAAAAAGGDQAATLAAIGAMGQTCGSCHDDYRSQ